MLPEHNALINAIDALANGDTLVLLDGIYSEDIDVLVGKALSIVSAAGKVSPKMVLLDGKTWGPLGHCLRFEGLKSAAIRYVTSR